MNYFVALSSAQDTAEQIEFFFSKANLIALFNKLCNWSVSLAGKIIMALIVWQIGKRLIIWLVKIILKALGKSDLDVGVVCRICHFNTNRSGNTGNSNSLADYGIRFGGTGSRYVLTGQFVKLCRWNFTFDI